MKFEGKFWFFFSTPFYSFCNTWYLITISDDDREVILKFFHRPSDRLYLHCGVSTVVIVDSVGGIAVSQRLLRV